MGITELADVVRRGLEQDAADIGQAWQMRVPMAERLTTMQGATVLMSGWRAHRDLAARRRLLDQALAWEHHHWPNVSRCEATIPGVTTCDCGRDERVLQVLQTLAAPYQEANRG